MDDIRTEVEKRALALFYSGYITVPLKKNPAFYSFGL
jgi:hypothetical protein